MQGGCIVTAEEWALAASSFFSGLAAGFLGGLCTIIRPMQAAMTGPEFQTFMERFLRYADNGLGKAFNYAWSGATTIASIVALVLLFDDPGSTSPRSAWASGSSGSSSSPTCGRPRPTK
jgi:hypothetical protein